MHVRAFDVKPDGTLASSSVLGEMKPWVDELNSIFVK